MSKDKKECDHDWYEAGTTTIGGVAYIIMKCKHCPAQYHSHK